MLDPRISKAHPYLIKAMARLRVFRFCDGPFHFNDAFNDRRGVLSLPYDDLLGGRRFYLRAGVIVPAVAM